MFSLENLAAAIPAYRHAGRFKLELFALLWPLFENETDEGVWLVPVTALSKIFDPEVLSGWKRSAQVSRAALRNHALVVRPRGQFLSTDKLSLAQLNVEGNRWAVDLALLRSENPDGEPAPRDLYVVLSLDTGDSRPQSLTLHIKGIWQDFRGDESAFTEPVANDVAVEFSE